MHNTALRAAPGVFDLLGVCSALRSSARLARVRPETCAESPREQARPLGGARCAVATPLRVLVQGCVCSGCLLVQRPALRSLSPGWGSEVISRKLGPRSPSKIEEVTLMRPIHGNL